MHQPSLPRPVWGRRETHQQGAPKKASERRARESAGLPGGGRGYHLRRILDIGFGFTERFVSGESARHFEIILERR